MGDVTNVASRVDRLETQRHGIAARRLIGEVAARHGLDAGSVRAETDRILARAAAGDGWSAEAELDLIAAETGLPVADVRDQYEGILTGMGR